MVDAQHKLEVVGALQHKLVPVVAEVNKLKAEITAVEGRLGSVKFSEAAAIDQEKRYTELVVASKAIATEVAERTRQMQGLAEELARSAKVKDELLAELDRVQGRQRDTVSQIQASRDRKSTRLNSSHGYISYAVFCLKKKKTHT